MAFEGQLTSNFRIPSYAQDMLYLVSAGTATPARGKQGHFGMERAPELPLRLVWGGANGPTLAVWQTIPDQGNLEWDGRVRVGGFVQRLHARELGGLEIVIAEVVGGSFPVDHVGLPSLDEMRRGIFARPSDEEPLDQDQSYPFIILAESNLASLVQDALVSGIAVDAYGALASEAGGWHEVVGLPLLLDTLTLLAP